VANNSVIPNIVLTLQGEANEPQITQQTDESSLPLVKNFKGETK
jgi:hypothetical protein